MAKFQLLRGDSLPETAPGTGIIRYLAFEGGASEGGASDCAGFRILRACSDPVRVSDWHHHGDYHVYGYVVSGLARFEGGEGGQEFMDVNPGDFFHIPPHTIHREMNPSKDEVNNIVLFLYGTGQTVFNVDGPDRGS